VGLALEIATWRSYSSWWRGAVDLAIGWAFLLTGFLASWRRPAKRVGALLTAVGLTWYAGNLRFLGNPAAYALGAWLAELPVAVLAQLVFAFPTGHLKSRADRVAVGGTYAAILGLSALRTLTLDPGAEPQCGLGAATSHICVRNGALLFHSRSLATLTANLHDGVLGLVTIAALGLLVGRWITATPPARRMLAPVLLVAVAIGSLSVSLELGDVSGAPVGLHNALYFADQVAILALPFAFLAGLLRSRLAQAAVSRLVVELGQTPPPGRLQRALARTLGDPSVLLAYWLPAKGRFVDLEGREVSLSEPSPGRAVSVLERGNEPIAALVHDAYLEQEPELVQAVGAAAGLALENERLHAQLRAQLEEVRASRARIVEAGDAERRRLERDLHDGAQQRLVTMALPLSMARARLEQAPDPALAPVLEDLASNLSLALAELRELARGIHPAILTEQGLGAALASLAERSPIPARVVTAPPGRLPANVEATAYFIVSEALANAAKHSGAGLVTISAASRRGELEVSVTDDGVGGAEPAGGSGLSGLEDRAAAVGGTLEVHSPPGAGTKVVARLPCG